MWRALCSPARSSGCLSTVCFYFNLFQLHVFLFVAPCAQTRAARWTLGSGWPGGCRRRMAAAVAVAVPRRHPRPALSRSGQSSSWAGMALARRGAATIQPCHTCTSRTETPQPNCRLPDAQTTHPGWAPQRIGRSVCGARSCTSEPDSGTAPHLAASSLLPVSPIYLSLPHCVHTVLAAACLPFSCAIDCNLPAAAAAVGDLEQAQAGAALPAARSWADVTVQLRVSHI